MAPIWNPHVVNELRNAAAQRMQLTIGEAEAVDKNAVRFSVQTPPNLLNDGERKSKVSTIGSEDHGDLSIFPVAPWRQLAQ